MMMLTMMTINSFAGTFFSIYRSCAVSNESFVLFIAKNAHEHKK